MTEDFRLDTKVTTKKRVNPVKLIAETQEESSKLNGLSALLLDLGIDVDRAELGKIPSRDRLEPYE